MVKLRTNDNRKKKLGPVQVEKHSGASGSNSVEKREVPLLTQA